MHVVFFLSPLGGFEGQKFDGEGSLKDALDFAQWLRSGGARFVTIASEDINQVGKLGVDSIVNGKLPDGNSYDWSKSSRIGKMHKSDLEKPASSWIEP